MAIWREVKGAGTAPSTSATVVTIGTFDGVHLGHQTLLAQARAVADASGEKVVAVTFDPHPVSVFAPDRAPRLLTGIERRVELLLAGGADEVRVLAFDRAMAAWSPDEFAQRVLVDDLRASHVVVGENFTYGSKAAGDVACLADFGTGHGFAVEAVELAGGSEEYSSSLVRRLVDEGDVAGAAAVLGRPAEVTGVVVRGDQRGRELGYPTANVPVPSDVAVPSDGVYAAWVTDLEPGGGERWAAAISVGDNPTFQGTERRVESYVIDRTGLDLYGHRIRVELVGRLRGMDTFDSLEALVEQMADDVERARQILR
ncbi:bifunctional riboflavin kinase/FAD synthetase [Aeromicrobium sp. Leaf350]|uniref:bifunctional riboflavin kinase/FAD synthetase n=1 Tax=Aeromicrobium sp. Leaf350 TaxID=2876565 RepID=UPI001E4C7942|nr:bifunctional riboflavin kinase/FAD synthetase [Aeromicrobium sp. Leaf350]